ncbi:hypothetical protein AB9K26_06430 [Psychroserpens sp. XS_ASV72]|uniref:hypothetical protein n=1 Tax=Psychroserpens sp. XS_ASV72 TaxID=3241293 RepID=UPI00351491F2
MKHFKTILLAIPEYVLILSVLFYWFSAGLTINYIAIALLAILIYQIIFKNKVIGIIIPIVLILTCLYMLLALFSEVREFPTLNSEATTLLIVGLLYFLTTMFIAVVMLFKYAIIPNKKH